MWLAIFVAKIKKVCAYVLNQWLRYLYFCLFFRRNRYVLVANFGEEDVNLEPVGQIYSGGELVLDTSKSLNVEPDQVKFSVIDLQPGEAIVIKLPKWSSISRYRLKGYYKNFRLDIANFIIMTGGSCFRPKEIRHTIFFCQDFFKQFVKSNLISRVPLYNRSSIHHIF